MPKHRDRDQACPSCHRPFQEREPLFSVSNHHVAGCGEPPVMNGDAAGTYVGYFVNEHGEQAVYTYDRKTGEATVRLGDAGWQNIVRVRDGKAERLGLTDSEAMWLRACWQATGAFRSRPVDGDEAQSS